MVNIGRGRATAPRAHPSNKDSTEPFGKRRASWSCGNDTDCCAALDEPLDAEGVMPRLWNETIEA
jgi:hypothetical protein